MKHACSLLGAALLAAAGCRSPQPRRITDENGATIFAAGVADAASFFRANRVMVGQVRHVLLDGTVELVYPSINDGPSPLYSHVVAVAVPEFFPYTLSDLPDANRFAVLRATDDPRTWELVGVVDTRGAGQPFDWFADKPRYRYRPAEQSQ